MILDYFKDLGKYEKACKGIADVIAFVKKNDLAALPAGRNEVSKEIYVNMIACETKPEPAEPLYEVHRQYIDLHYIFEGSETVLWQGIGAGEETREYSDAEDAAFFKAAQNVRLNVSKGMFCIFFPQDLHCPLLANGAPERVRKAVFKIPV